MPSPSPLQTLPPLIVEIIVDHVAASVRHQPPKWRYFGGAIENYRMLQVPLLWVCRNFRAIVRPLIYKCYELKFEWNKDRVRRTPTGLPSGLEQLRGPFHLVAKEVKMLVGACTIFSGFASGALSHSPYNGYSFPLARTLEISFRRSNEQERNPVALPVAEANITTFLQRIQQMMPRLGMVKLVGGLTPREQGDVVYHQFESLTTQLIGLVSQVDIDSGCNRVVPFLRLNTVRNLTYLCTNFDLDGEQIKQLIQQNSSTLQYLSIISCASTNLSGIIQDADSGHARYPHLQAFEKEKGMVGIVPQQFNFDGTVPFTNLLCLISSGS